MEITEQEHTEEQTQTKEQKSTNWLKDEVDKLPSGFDGEKVPPMKFETGKITTITIGFGEPFREWVDSSNGVIKKMIPVIHKGENKLLWLNVKNPLYSELCKRGLAGQVVFKISTTGSQAETRYSVVEED